MKALRAGLLAAIAIFALPSAAAAEELVPPDNSAVNQYTETFPTSGGDKEAKQGQKRRTPAKVLGDRNAEKLEQHGPEGRKVATVAAATAPSPVVADETEPVEEEPADDGAGAGGGAGGNPSGGGDRVAVAPAHEVGRAAGGADGPAPAAEQPSGSSGLGEVLAQATGTSSSGGLGLLLPLAIAATAVWALVSVRRRTRRAAQ